MRNQVSLRNGHEISPHFVSGNPLRSIPETTQNREIISLAFLRNLVSKYRHSSYSYKSNEQLDRFREIHFVPFPKQLSIVNYF